MMSSCKIRDCNGEGKLSSNGRRYLIKGYCRRHYQRFYRRGDAEHISFVIPGNPGKRSEAFRDGCRLRDMSKVTMFGRSHSAASKDKIRYSKTGKLTGELNPNWKGGVSPSSKIDRDKFRRTIQHKVFKRDDYSCVICKARGKIQVDHIKEWSEYPELRFDMNNCRTLCMGCHYYKTFGRTMPEGITWGHGLAKSIRKIG